MSESSVETLEKTLVPRLIWTGGLTSLDTSRGVTQKKAGFPCSGLNLRSCFMSQDEGMSESPVETLEIAVGLRLIWTGGIISL